MNGNNKGTMIQLSGLWIQKGKDATFFAGNLGSTRILIFKNKKKEEGSKQPDYIMYLAPNEYKKPEVKAKPQETEDDLPF